MGIDLLQSPLQLGQLETATPTKLRIAASPEATAVQDSRPRADAIPRICSDWGDDLGPGSPDWKSDLVLKRAPQAQADIIGWQDLYMKCLDWSYDIPIEVPPDPRAEFGETVVVSRQGDSVSIYDAYLLKANIASNENDFRRLQIVHNPSVGLYSLIARNGRVGLLGGSIIWLQTPVLCIAVQRFEHFFHQNTGYSWETRYTPSSRSSFNYREFTYVDLDYSIPTNNNILFPESPKHSSKFELPNFNMGEPVKRLMEDILFGGTAQVRAAAQEQPSLPGTWPNPFTAPRQHLSLRTAMAAFNMLQRISSYLEPKLNNPSAIRWKTIIEASSIYRSTIPFCGGQFSSDRPPVICNYYAVLVELEFLYSLFPREEIAAMMSDMACRLTAQQAVYGRALSTELLYQAYSSLRHGFRLVTDASSQEFQQLTNYLYGSCQGTHNMSFQLRGIYRVFTKTKAENPFDDWIQSSNNNKINSSKPSRLLLWHGTPLASLLGILEHGVQIHKRPEPQRPYYRQPTRPRLPRASAGINPGVIVTTRKAYRPRRTNHRYTRPAMFGAGIYLADASSKSAGYCQARTASNGEAVLLLCEADVGDEERRVRTYQSLPDGHDVVDEFGAQETRCIEGIGKTGPRRLEHGGWKRIGWDMDGGRGGGMQRGDGRDVWMPDTSTPYGIEHRNATLLFNEYVLFNPAHVRIRYIVRLNINDAMGLW